MSRRDDVSKLYKIPNTLDGIKFVLFGIDVIAGIIAISNNQSVMSIAITVQIVAAFFFFLISVMDDGYFWY